MSYNHSDNVYNDPDNPERFGNFGNYNYGPYAAPYPYSPTPDFGAYYYGYAPPQANYPANGNFGGYSYGSTPPPFTYSANGSPGAWYYGTTPLHPKMQRPPSSEGEPGGFNFGSPPPPPPQRSAYPDGTSGGCKCGSAPPPKNSSISEEVPGRFEQKSAPPPQHPIFSFTADSDEETEDTDGYDFKTAPPPPPDELPVGFGFEPITPLHPRQSTSFPFGAEPDGEEEHPGGHHYSTWPPQSHKFPDEHPGGCNCRPMPPHPPLPPFPFCKRREDDCDPLERCRHKHHHNDDMVCCPKPKNCVCQNICQRFCINDLAKLCKVELKGTAIHNCEERICLSYKIFVEYLDCCCRRKTFCRNAIIQFPRPLICGPCEHYSVDIANPPQVQVCGKELTVRTSVEICCRH